MNIIILSYLCLPSKNVFSHNLIGGNKIIISTLNHIKFFTELSLLSMSGYTLWELLHVHLSTVLFKISPDGSICGLHHLYEEEEFTEWDLTILIYISNMKNFFYLCFVCSEVFVVILWSIVVVWNKCFQEFLIRHFKISIITIACCEMSENTLWSSVESNLVIFITLVFLWNRRLMTFILLLVVLIQEQAQSH